MAPDNLKLGYAAVLCQDCTPQAVCADDAWQDALLLRLRDVWPDARWERLQ